MPNEMNSPSVTDGFHLVVDALKLNGISTIFGVAGIPITRYDKLIEAFDGTGHHVIDPRSLTKALTGALASGQPALINCVIDPSAGTESGHLQNLNPQSQVSNRKEA